MSAKASRYLKIFGKLLFVSLSLSFSFVAKGATTDCTTETGKVGSRARQQHAFIIKREFQYLFDRIPDPERTVTHILYDRPNATWQDLYDYYFDAARHLQKLILQVKRLFPALGSEIENMANHLETGLTDTLFYQQNRGLILKAKLADLRRREIYEEAMHLSNYFQGMLGELHSVLFFGEDLAAQNTSLSLAKEQRRAGRLSPAASIILSKLTDNLKAHFKSLHQEVIVSEEASKAVYERLKSEFPNLISIPWNKKFLDNLWGHMNAIELDGILFRSKSPGGFSFLEVKSPTRAADIWYVRDYKNQRGKTVLQSLERRIEFLKFLRVDRLAKLELYFPWGITDEARQFLESKGMVVHDGELLGR